MSVIPEYRRAQRLTVEGDVSVQHRNNTVHGVGVRQAITYTCSAEGMTMASTSDRVKGDKVDRSSTPKLDKNAQVCGSLTARRPSAMSSSDQAKSAHKSAYSTRQGPRTRQATHGTITIQILALQHTHTLLLEQGADPKRRACQRLRLHGLPCAARMPVEGEGA